MALDLTKFGIPKESIVQEQPAEGKLDLTQFGIPADAIAEERQPQQQGKPLDLTQFGISAEAITPLETKQQPDQLTGPKPTALESGVAGAVQGLTFDFADEIAGGIESAITGADYKQTRDRYRKYFDQAAKANPAAYMGGTVVGGVGAVFVPGLGWLNAGKSVMSAAKVGAAAGALYGAGSAEELKDVPGQALAQGAVGAATGAAFAGLLKTVGGMKASPKTKDAVFAAGSDHIANGMPLDQQTLGGLARVLEESDQGFRLTETLQQLDNVAAPKDIGKIIRNDSFVRFFNKIDDNAKITPQLRAQTADVIESTLESGLVDNSWQQWRKVAAVKKFVKSEAERLSETLDDNADALSFGKIAATFKDPTLIFEPVDRAFNGMTVADTLRDMSTATRKTQTAALPFLQPLEKLKSQMDSAFKGQRQLLDDAFTASSKAARPKLNAQQAAAVEQYDSIMASFADYAESMGHKIDRLEVYRPIVKKSIADTYRDLGEALRQVDTFDPNSELGRAINSLPTGGKVTTVPQAKRALKDMLSSDAVKKDMNVRGSLAFERTDPGVPQLLREVDPITAAARYISSNTKAIHVQPVLDELYMQSKILKGLGLNKHAEYLDNYVLSMAGQPSDFYAVVTSAANRWRGAIDDTFGSMRDAGMLKDTTYRTMRNAPDILDWMTTTIYPNVMGANIHAPIRNMTQTWVLTAPELKGSFNPGSYGYKAVAKAWTRGVKNYKQILKKLDELGLTVDQNKLESARKEIGSPINNKLVQAIDWWNEKAMTFYTASDTYNRVFTWETAQVVAEDLMKGNKNALTFVNRLSGRTKQQVIQAMKDGNAEAAGDALGRYLLSKTQFDYGKAGLNEFGRKYGRVASMFSKWPVMILSDIDDARKAGRGAEAFRKYAAPFVLAATGHQVLSQAEAYDNPAVSALLGRSVLSWSPASSILGIQTPPLIDAVLTAPEVIKDAASGDLAKALGKAKKTATPFMPLGGMGDVIYNRYLKERN